MNTSPVAAGRDPEGRREMLTPARRPAYFHTGDNSGYLAVNARLPDEQITLAVLANDQATDILQATVDLLKLAS